MRYIEGIERYQRTILPEVLDDYVSEDNPVRVIDAYVSSLAMEELKFEMPKGVTGRPPYDPKDLLRLYIYGYFNRIRSSRRLEKETKRNLEVIWLMNKLSPDHKTISDYRKNNPTALKNVYKDFVKLCMKLELYGKELAAIDGSKFRAVNSKDRNFNEQKLNERIARVETRIAEYLNQMEEQDKIEEESDRTEKTAEEIEKIITELKERKTKYEGYRDKLKNTNETQISLTDEDSRRMVGNGKSEISFNVQTAVDSKNKMIIDFDVTSQGTDVNQLSTMSRKAAEMLEVEKLTVVADTGYNSATDIAKCIENNITAHVAGAEYDICVPAEEVHAEVTSNTDGRCVYIEERNIAICPMGKVLYPNRYKTNKRAAIFCNRKACMKCNCKCTESRYKEFEITMKKEDFSKTYNDENLAVKQIRIKPDKNLVKLRKTIVEHPFGTIKRGMDAGYCLTKGLSKVRGEFSLLFLAYNLKRAINILGVKRLIQELQMLRSNQIITKAA